MDLPLRPNYRGGQLVVEYATVGFRSQEDFGPIVSFKGDLFSPKGLS